MSTPDRVQDILQRLRALEVEVRDRNDMTSSTVARRLRLFREGIETDLRLEKLAKGAVLRRAAMLP